MDLDGLDDSQLGQILQHLVSRFDESGELAITAEELAVRTVEDREFLDEAGTALAIVPSADRPPLRAVVETIGAEVPESRQTIEDAAARARRVGTLPLSDMAADILVIAAAAAILRPRFHFRRRTKDSEVDIRIEAGGDKNLRTVLETVLRYLRQG
ncbi:hypothetical protein CLV71_113222 [Actinophytocola oryzae]|uniref:Uncharacterized protein n=2 Tax=Actinophytocola oryzae TaxID=502181 RepID=A0A4R7V7Q7_9PSEU|nr:hypothetical protein CLV71_113222 [Actinophytocola oryzae]